MKALKDKKGFTLAEVLIVVAILGVMMLGLYQILGTALSAEANTEEKQELLIQTRYAMERMVMFAQEADSIVNPASPNGEEKLMVSERVLDTYSNTTHAYVAEGDGIPDADNNADGLINDSTADPPDYITFNLDKTDASNWKLREQMPDYGNATPGSFLPYSVLCEHVISFLCKPLAANLVEIQLTLQYGKSIVSLKTRVRARRL